jgi:ATP-dependent Zn protease
MDQKKVKIARHETGHAVMALICGQGIRSISLREMDSPKGTDKYLAATKLEPFEQKPTLTINELTRRVMISLGGYASEILFYEGSANIGGDDLTSAVNWVEAMMQSEDFRNSAARLPVPAPGALDMIANPTVRACIDYQMQFAVNKLAPYIPVIQVIAEKLCVSDELTGAQITDLFNSFVEKR